ncbi:hypothetical protein SAMN05216249_10915 [Acetitomaculum ruminis DSM 5522]|uniref:Flagellar hook-length control protein FliK n=1 Tax=Acetitomaculum ruminis DSM 5522 TaxID=1120918 RepID=A0A1I0YAH7_9FIRM|nr:DUF6240 domain-containing protein [Acetitomaculum ruminis]SFB09418.1 hypothetical protein SAMN05216249_10915 [Acetitomaculum ruminis DSM 5522]
MLVEGASLTKVPNPNISGINIKESETEVEKKSNNINIDYEAHSVISTNIQKSFNEVLNTLKNGENEELSKEDIALVKKQLEYITKNMTGNDAKIIQGEGFNLEDTDVEGIITVVEKIKIALAKGKDFQMFGSEVSATDIEGAVGNTSLASSLSDKLSTMDIPVNDINIYESKQALETAGDLMTPGEGSIKYILENDLEPTINNLYVAEHSGSSEENTKHLSKKEWQQLEEQVVGILKSQGFEISDENLSISKWMIENDIELTGKNIEKYKAITNITFPVDEETVINSIANAIMLGKNPTDALLTGDEKNLYEKSIEYVEVLENASDIDLATLVYETKELTISNLRQAANKNREIDIENIKYDNTLLEIKSIVTKASETEVLEDSENFDFEGNKEKKNLYMYISYRARLEQTRLIMTSHSFVRMMKMGIDVELEPLESLVTQLGKEKQKIYELLFLTEGLEANDENIKSYNEILDVVSETKNLPDTVLGVENVWNKSVNIKTVYYEGQIVLQEFNERQDNSYETLSKSNKALDRYEESMTDVRKDLGDNIQKAFRNVDAILESMNLETSMQNRQATRILAYNSISITKENIETVKVQLLKVNNVLEGLTPSNVMKLIKDKINPLEMDMDELKETLSKIDNSDGQKDSQKYSEFLWKLENNNEITFEQRESYVGLYRILNVIEKSDGAFLGALMNQNAEITLKNLMTASRNMRDSGMDYSIDDNFFGIEFTGINNEITSQAMTAFSDNSNKDNKNSDEYNKEQAKSILNKISPEKLASFEKVSDIESAGLDELEDYLYTCENEEAVIEEENKIFNEKARMFSEFSTSESQVLALLKDCNIPLTAYNILAAGNMLNKRNTWFNQVLESANDDIEVADLKEQVLEKFAESVKSPKEMAQALNELADKAENVLKAMTYWGDTYDNVNAVRMMQQQLFLMKQLAKEENYCVPVMVGNKLTGINLKIIRGANAEDKGKVNITFDSESIGEVAAEISIKGKIVNAFIAAKYAKSAKLLEDNGDTLKEMLSDNDKYMVNLVVLSSDSLEINKFMLNSDKSNKEVNTQDEEVQTKELYYAAKSFLTFVSDEKLNIE